MMKKYLLVISAVILLFGVFAWAQQESPIYSNPYSSYSTTDLKLTTDQQQKLADLEIKYQTDILNIDKEIAQKDIDLRKLMLVDKPDTKAIEKLESEIVSLQNKRYNTTLDFRNKSRSILTDEQLKTNPYAFMGPGLCPYYSGGTPSGYGGGMMRGYGPGYGAGGMMRGWGPGW